MTSAATARRLKDARFIRFVLMGGVNTAITLILYWVLLRVTTYTVAYTATLIAGIALSYVLNSKFVFKAPVSAGRAAAFPLVYVVQYAVGLGVLWLWTDAFGQEAKYGIFLVVLVTLPITYILGRAVLTGQWRGF